MDKLATDILITNTKGLHARAAAKFVKKVEEFHSEVTVTCNDRTVSGRSIMGLMMLAARAGTTITLSAQGQDSETVLDALKELINSKFYEE